MPPDSTGRFLTAPVRAIRSFRKYSHLVSYQEPVRSLSKLLRASRAPELSGPLGPSVQLVQLVQLV